MEGFCFEPLRPPPSLHPAPGISSWFSYISSKNVAFKTPLPLGISNDLPCSWFGFFLELHNGKFYTWELWINFLCVNFMLTILSLELVRQVRITPHQIKPVDFSQFPTSEIISLGFVTDRLRPSALLCRLSPCVIWTPQRDRDEHFHHGGVCITEVAFTVYKFKGPFTWQLSSQDELKTRQQLFYSGEQIRNYNFDPPANSLRANLGGWILIR